MQGRYLGWFSLDIVAWDSYPRWPRLVPAVAPIVRRAQRRLESLLRRTGSYGGTAPLAPFVAVTGRKPAAR